MQTDDIGNDAIRNDDIGIVSAGVYVPRTYQSAAEIAELSGIPEEIVITKLGIVRKPVPGPDDHTNAMARWAAVDALLHADVDPMDIDVVLCTTEEWKEHPLWTAGIHLAHEIGARRAWAIDVQMRCATTMTALKMAKALMRSDPDIRTVLIAGGYRNGDFVNYRDPSTRFLYNLAAGGGALLLQKGHGKNRLRASDIRVDGSFSLDVIPRAGGTVEPLTDAAVETGRHYLTCTDPEGMKERLDRLSMQNFLGVVDTALEKSGYGRGDIGYLNILHMKPSAHRFILEELGLREDQTSYLDHYGHIGQQDQAISIQLGLESGRLRDGMVMVMVAAGIGYAWSASVVEWGPVT